MASLGSWSLTTIYQCGPSSSRFSARGYCAVALADAEEAVKHYYSERPAAVLLEMVIPGRMDGLGILAAFKRIDRDVPVIVMSAHGPTTSVVQAMKLGASDFISKPFSESELDVPLSNALKQHQLSRDLAALRESSVTVEASSPAPGRQPGDG